MATLRWVPRLVVDSAHLDQLREHGGLPGIRDENALEAALARPQQKAHSEPDSHLATLAAAYAFGLAKGEATIMLEEIEVRKREGTEGRERREAAKEEP